MSIFSGSGSNTTANSNSGTNNPEPSSGTQPGAADSEMVGQPGGGSDSAPGTATAGQGASGSDVSSQGGAGAGTSTGGYNTDQRVSGANIYHVNAAIGEQHGWQSAINDDGHIGIKPPGNVSSPGVDYITYDADSGTIFLWDVKYRGPNGNYPASVPPTSISRWESETRGYINSMPDSDLKNNLLDALDNGRVTGEIFKWPPQ